MSNRFHRTDFEFLPEQAFRPRFRGGSMTLEGGGGKGSAPKPDPNVGLAAQRQIELAERQYNDFSTNYAPFLKDQMAQGLRIANEENMRADEMADYQLGRARKFDERYDGVQVPLEDQIIGMARAYNEPAEQERMARLAAEDVGAAFDGAEGRIARGLASRGIRAGSGASAAAYSGMDIQRALAEASAINKTRQAAKDIGWTRLGEAAALGRGLPGFGNASASLSMGAGDAAFRTGTAGVGIVGGASGASNSGYTAGGGLYSGAGGLLNTQYSTRVQAANSSGGGLGSLVGGLAGSFLGPMGSMAGEKLGSKLFT